MQTKSGGVQRHSFFVLGGQESPGVWTLLAKCEVKQNSNKMKQITAEARCIQCDEPITNPICPDCLAKQMRAWLSEIAPSLSKEISGFGMDGEIACIFCGNSMSICAHCFSKDIYEQLKEKDAKIAREFMSRFDFDLRRELLV